MSVTITLPVEQYNDLLTKAISARAAQQELADLILGLLERQHVMRGDPVTHLVGALKALKANNTLEATALLNMKVGPS